MVADGLILEVTDQQATPIDDERRRCYRLTKRGWQAAQTKVQRLVWLIDVARQEYLFTADAAHDRDL
jgi:hypothetical protein